MIESFNPQWLIVGVVPALILAALALNYKRAKRWEDKARAHGHVHCRSCGFVGDLAVRSVSTYDMTSSNLRLVCAKCNSSDWFIPENEKAA
jgi:hypothetical protein